MAEFDKFLPPGATWNTPEVVEEGTSDTVYNQEPDIDTLLPPGATWNPEMATDVTAPSLIEEYGQNYDKRSKAIFKSGSDYGKGEIGFYEGMVQHLGQNMGLIFDQGVTTVKHALMTIGDGIEYAFPEIYEGAGDKLSEARDWVLNSEEGKEAMEAISKGQHHYGVWCKKHPQRCKTLGSVVNLGMAFKPIKEKWNADPVPTFGTKQHLGKKMADNAHISSKAGKRSDKIQELLHPKDIDTEMSMRMEQKGLLRTNTLELNDLEKEMIENVSRLKTVNPNRSNQYNLTAIRKANTKKAEFLKMRLEKIDDIFIDSNVVKANIERDISELFKAKVWLSTTEGAGTAVKMHAQKALELLEEFPKTPAGLLQVRKAFDKYINGSKPGTFNPIYNNATSEALMTIRTSLNKYLDDIVPSEHIEVHKALAEQASLWRATHLLKPKAIKEMSNAVGRTWQNVSRVLELKMGANRAFAVIAGTSAFAASSAVIPFVGGTIAVGGVFYIATRGLNTMASKLAFGKILTLVDKSIKTSTNGQMIKQLRIDRAAIQDLFELPIQKEENKTEK